MTTVTSSNTIATGRPDVQAAAPVLTPPADHGPLRQLTHRDKGQPDPDTDNMAKNP
jgi:hypothetical protein